MESDFPAFTLTLGGQFDSTSLDASLQSESW